MPAMDSSLENLYFTVIAVGQCAVSDAILNYLERAREKQIGAPTPPAGYCRRRFAYIMRAQKKPADS